jgi:flagellar biosynthesis/type III secretory pathway ATPase
LIDHDIEMQAMSVPPSIAVVNSSQSVPAMSTKPNIIRQSLAEFARDQGENLAIQDEFDRVQVKL